MEVKTYSYMTYTQKVKAYTEAQESISEQIEEMMDRTGFPRAYCTMRVLRKPENREAVEFYLKGHPGNRAMEG